MTSSAVLPHTYSNALYCVPAVAVSRDTSNIYCGNRYPFYFRFVFFHLSSYYDTLAVRKELICILHRQIIASKPIWVEKAEPLRTRPVVIKREFYFLFSSITTRWLMSGMNSAMKNPHVSQQAKQHAQDELNQIESSTAGGQERHEGNVKRGLKAYVFPSLFPLSSAVIADRRTEQLITPM